LTQQLPEQQPQPMDGPDVLFQDSLIENLTGEWKISRKIRNHIDENRARVEWILNHQFLQIHMLDVKAPPEYEALVLIGYYHENSATSSTGLMSSEAGFPKKGLGCAVRFCKDPSKHKTDMSLKWLGIRFPLKRSRI
jgi:hypothetical protein